MKLKKAKLRRFGDDGWTKIERSELPIGIMSMQINWRINNLKKFIIATQKGERQLHIQTKKYIQRYSEEETENSKLEYHLYLNAIEYAILELYRMIEVYHHEFIAHINEEIEIDLLNSPKFDFCKKKLIENEIYISKIKGYEKVLEIKNISNDLKHSYIKEYSLSKTLKLKTFKDFDRKILVDKINAFFVEIPNYIINLGEEINKKYPKIEIKQ
jgi:hypothetical protein